MAEISSFVAYRYNPACVELKKAVTQPYDKITPQMQEHYYSLSPYNLIPVEKGRPAPDDTPEHNVYTRAAEKLEEWIAQGILVRDPAPALFVYFQEYSVPGTKQRRTRKGFIALGRLEDYSTGTVYRHERTLSAPKADRLELLRRTRTQTGLLFMLYSDPARRVDALLEQAAHTAPAMEVRDEYDVVHRLWPVADAARIQQFVQEMQDKKLIIADGHHRYETALAYRDECRARASVIDPSAPHEKAMMAFFNTHAEGLTILPTHRLVTGIASFDFERFRKQLESQFDWYAYPFSDADERATSLGEFRKDLAGRGRGGHAIGIYAGGSAFYLFLLRRDANLDTLLSDVSPGQRQLDVVLLHRLLLEKGLGIFAEAVATEKNLSYEREMDVALDAVETGRAQLACLLNPVRIEQVCQIALAGEVLPQKSTDFYPKLLSGLSLYRLEE